MQTYQAIEGVFDVVVSYCILLMEAIGVCVLLYTAVSCVVALFRRDPRVRVRLAEGISLSLSFKLGGEVLRTLIVREWKEIYLLGAIILLRAAMAFLLQWEIKNEQKRLPAEPVPDGAEHHKEQEL